MDSEMKFNPPPGTVPVKVVRKTGSPKAYVIRVIFVDKEIEDLVRALNDAGLETIASCSGHGIRHGRISLRDGRELIIARDYDEATRIDGINPIGISREAVRWEDPVC